MTRDNASIGKLTMASEELCSLDMGRFFLKSLMLVAAAASLSSALSPLFSSFRCLAASLSAFRFSARACASRRLCSRSSLVLAMLLLILWVMHIRIIVTC